MRKRLVLPLLTVVLSLPTWAVEEGGPAKGDTVYVSADLVVGTRVKINACVASKVTRSSPEQQIWKVRPDGLNTVSPKLKGPWLPRMHKTEAECDDFFAEHGQPKMTQSGANVHTIPPQPEPVTEEEEEAP